MTKTAADIRAEVEAAKVEARATFDRNIGRPGAYDRLGEYGRANNKKALDSICAYLDRNGR